MKKPLYTLLDNLDFDSMELLVDEMEHYQHKGGQKELFDQLRNAVDEIDMDTCVEIIDYWETQLL